MPAPTLDLQTATFWDERTDLYWYEIGDFYEGQWSPIVLSGINYKTRQLAEYAGDLALIALWKTLEKHNIKPALRGQV